MTLRVMQWWGLEGNVVWSKEESSYNSLNQEPFTSMKMTLPPPPPPTPYPQWSVNIVLKQAHYGVSLCYFSYSSLPLNERIPVKGFSSEEFELLLSLDWIWCFPFPDAVASYRFSALSHESKIIIPNTLNCLTNVVLVLAWLQKY